MIKYRNPLPSFPADGSHIYTRLLSSLALQDEQKYDDLEVTNVTIPMCGKYVCPSLVAND